MHRCGGERRLAMNDELANLNDRWHRQLGRSPGSIEPSSQAQVEGIAQLREASSVLGIGSPAPTAHRHHPRGSVCRQVGSATRREYTVMAMM